jgi:hypothetical protein
MIEAIQPSLNLVHPEQILSILFQSFLLRFRTVDPVDNPPSHQVHSGLLH